MLARRLILLFLATSLASFAKNVELAGNIFGSGISFDAMQIFVESSGTQFDSSAPVSYSSTEGFADWSFTLNTATYLAGEGSATTGSKLTLTLSDSSSGESADPVILRVYLMRQGKIVGTYLISIGGSGLTVTPLDADLAALAASQQEAYTIAGIPNPQAGATAGGGDGGGGFTYGGGTSSGGGSTNGGTTGGGTGGGDTTGPLDLVPEPGPGAMVASALIALALLRGFRRLSPPASSIRA